MESYVIPSRGDGPYQWGRQSLCGIMMLTEGGKTEGIYCGGLDPLSYWGRQILCLMEELGIYMLPFVDLCTLRVALK